MGIRAKHWGEIPQNSQMTPVNWNCFGSSAHTAETSYCSQSIPGMQPSQPSPTASLREGKERISGLASQMAFFFLLGRGGVGACASTGWRAAGMRRGGVGWLGLTRFSHGVGWDKSAFNKWTGLCPSTCSHFSPLGVCETASNNRNGVSVQTLVSTGTESQRRQNPSPSRCWRSCARSCFL